MWRFCYIIAKDGGSASLFAYIVCFIFVATPLFMYEMIIGQFLRLHALNAWKFIHPRWQGLAYAQCFMLWVVLGYFVMILAYTIPYMLGSCQDPLPWLVHPNGSQGYWNQEVLGFEVLSGNETKVVEGNEMQLHLVGSLLLVWVVIYFSISFGKEMLARITYFTVLSPVVLVIILVIRTCMLPGAMDGLAFYMGKFEGAKLLELDVWANALSQCLFSLSPGFGTAITMSSYTRKTEDTYKAAIITSVANTAFAIISGVAVFAMVGNIAHETGTEVEVVASTGGQGLAFIVIASAMSTFGAAANSLSVMFFAMLFLLGLDSAFAWCESLVASAEDIMEQAGMEKRPKWLTSLIASIATFLIGLPYATSKGNKLLDSVDAYVGINFLLFVCFVEMVAINFDFGWNRLEYALQKATGGKRSLRPLWKCCRFDFHLAIPFATLGLFVYQMYNLAKEPYMPNYPTINSVGLALMVICVATVLFGILVQGSWAARSSSM